VQSAQRSIHVCECVCVCVRVCVCFVCVCVHKCVKMCGRQLKPRWSRLCKALNDVYVCVCACMCVFTNVLKHVDEARQPRHWWLSLVQSAWQSVHIYGCVYARVYVRVCLFISILKSVDDSPDFDAILSYKALGNLYVSILYMYGCAYAHVYVFKCVLLK